MAEYSTRGSLRAREDGYFDELFSILETHHHPVILVEEGAMRWMGLRTCPEENLDLLVRDSQADAILAAFLATDTFERVDQDISYRLEDRYTKQVPRLRDTRCEPSAFTCVNLWTEAVYKLQVEDAEPVAVTDIHAWNVNLVEERFGTVPETAHITSSARTKEGMRTVPKVRSSARGVPIFVPSIPRCCDAVLDQLSYRDTYPEDFEGKMGNRPAYHLRNFIRYLYLERPSQRGLLLPLLAERNRAEMERRIDAFKRKPSLAMIWQSRNNQGKTDLT
ncbi:MAG: hypothetical protein M1833_002692 [Piccolia ochrophora]|nr:MAG: hypothetical protein M1833_002692 [Piccolia ochrophora]